MLDAKGRVQVGTPLHRLQALLAAGGLVLHPYAGDVLDTCEHVGDVDDAIGKLRAVAEDTVIKGGRPGVALPVKFADLRHLVDAAINPRASAQAADGADDGEPAAKRKK